MRTGIIGLGSIARKHISALRQLVPDVEITALRSSRTSETDGIRNVYTFEELLEFSPDFIIVSNPTSVHHETIGRLKDSGIPLFIEKPLFDKLYGEPETTQQTYVACNMRFLGCLQYLKENIRDWRINEMNLYCGSFLPEWRPGSDWRESYSASRKKGGGVHLDLIHETDYLFWLLGAPKNVRKTLRNVSSLNIDACDYANYCLEYPGFAVSVILNYYRRIPKRTMEILTDQTVYEVNLLENSIKSGDDVIYQGEKRLADTYRDQMSYFLSALKTGENFNDMNEAYKVLEICL